MFNSSRALLRIYHTPGFLKSIHEIVSPRKRNINISLFPAYYKGSSIKVRTISSSSTISVEMAATADSLALVSNLPPPMREYLIHFAQVHETFRKPELESLAKLFNIDYEILQYSEKAPFARIALKSNEAAKTLISRSILSKAIYELWGTGTTYDEVHTSVKSRTSHLWHLYKTCSFKFGFESFNGMRTESHKKELIESFSYVGFDGPIRMKNPDELFVIMEDYEATSMVDLERFAALNIDEKAETPSRNPTHLDEPHQIYFTRFIGKSSRPIIETYDLKKRNYIGTTSMDAELSLVTANMAHVGPGKLAYDPFVGTGSFAVACAHFGAVTFGSDIDGRMIRGTKSGKSLRSNFKQYKIMDRYGDMFVSDLTNSPLGRFGATPEGGKKRSEQIFDAIICDPPYGVREGLKVLGSRDPSRPKVPTIIDGVAQHTLKDFVPPKRPYSFDKMLNDIMNFASTHLVPNGRLCIWLPTADEDFNEFSVPAHRNLKLESICVQNFNKWSRRLLTYTRYEVDQDQPVVDEEALPDATEETLDSAKARLARTADALNPFRRKYFEGFKTPPSED
ncbi:hypothetical protein TWF225_001255 [Orbilia oligospora]|uniref:tRNA (guanine(10)-N(2))-methyltransferase n=1 Tax=Orbilia oligospora TaxID=2813651 RepID=A0A7C8PQZ8_ORBOL|nr:hypothetical protein TWF225_001255 [Orbilia oligospora]KAF3175968.1 hypothetical protein TWF751_003726 [Orbilia oligospora]KAF3247300.1 hypothetical protein TWF217_009707 [Orbilia oligospora]KAF3256225.1 hypothetical protein TWF128_005309 [Orbilia oligospora]KAF3279693.1 hypothetical protein TWF132_012014 [Orbilia oligospora]